MQNAQTIQGVLFRDLKLIFRLTKMKAVKNRNVHQYCCSSLCQIIRKTEQRNYEYCYWYQKWFKYVELYEGGYSSVDTSRKNTIEGYN